MLWIVGEIPEARLEAPFKPKSLPRNPSGKIICDLKSAVGSMSDEEGSRNSHKPPTKTDRRVFSAVLLSSTAEANFNLGINKVNNQGAFEIDHLL